MKIIIRCDANTDIATGHVKRCLNIAYELKNKGVTVIFALASDSTVDYVKDLYRVIKFDNEYNEPLLETEKMVKVLNEEKPELLLIDSYFVSPEYMKEMQKYTKVAYIDDLYERVWPADIIINYGIIADSYPYEKDYCNSVKLLGPKYMPINQLYKGVSTNQIKSKAENVLVVSGGSDENHVMLKLLSELCVKNSKSDNDLYFTFILGAFNKDYDKMLEISKDKEWIKILKSLPSLVNAINESDIIVSAGGTTLYEMAILGCPGIIYKIADNQSENIKGFVQENIALYAGDVREDFSYEVFVNMIYDLANDYEQRKKLSDKGKLVIDANGASRLAEELIKNGNN